MDIASYIDHTVLRPTTTLADITQLCDEAGQFGFAAVCVPPPFVKNAKALLKHTNVRIATVIGFPFGYSVAEAKLAEVSKALSDGADELDVVINISALKSGSWNYLHTEMELLTKAIHEQQKIIKVIIESGILTEEEIIRCCDLYAGLKVDFLKTSTGYAQTGATIEAVQLMRANLPSDIKIKASGGIKTYATAKNFIDAGAERIGCSAGVAIIKEQS